MRYVQQGELKLKILQPCNDRILVIRRQPVTEQNGIQIPDHSQEKPSEGIIFAVGPWIMTSAKAIHDCADLVEGAEREDQLSRTQTFDIGDEVVFGKYSGIEFTVDENSAGARTFVQLKADEILSVIIDVPMTEAPGHAPEGKNE